MSTSAIIRVTSSNGITSSIQKHNDGDETLTGKIIMEVLQDRKWNHTTNVMPILMMNFMNSEGTIIKDGKAQSKHLNGQIGGVYMIDDLNPNEANEAYFWDIRFINENFPIVTLYRDGHFDEEFDCFDDFVRFINNQIKFQK